MFFQTHRKGITIAFNLLFWLVTCYLFLRASALRPMCDTHLYKEVVCVGIIALLVLLTRCLTIPKLFQHGRYALFWIVSVCLLFLASIAEILLVKPDIADKLVFARGKSIFFLNLFGFVFLRDSCFFAWFLVFRLYALQKDAFRAKQRASVMEYQSVQFSTPDQKEISIPIDMIVYIQEIGHSTHIHCIDGDDVAVMEPLSYCKEMIPVTLWVSDGSEKMVFHHNLAEFFQSQQKPAIREIKTVTLLNSRQSMIFEIIRRNSGCTAKFIQDNLQEKVTLRTIERDLTALRDKGVILHIGCNKGSGYEVNGDSVVLAN